MSDFALQRCFPPRREAVIDPDIGSGQRPIGSIAKVFDRAELDLHLACFRHGRIRAVEGTVGPRPAAPGDSHSHSNERRKRF
jgi:hypothetical protein